MTPTDPSAPTPTAATGANPPWAELVQLVPVIVLASSFLVNGEVDLARATPLFVVAAALTVPITGLVLSRGHVLNPILVGTDLWLWLGAVAFGLPIPPLAAALADARAAALFACALAVGIVATAVSPTGYVGSRGAPRWVLRASIGLLALTVAIVAWSWAMRANLRLGGGLPFILVNVVRRVVIARGAPLSGPAAHPQ